MMKVQEHGAAVDAAVASLKDKWVLFRQQTFAVQRTWGEVVKAATALDGLPQGDPPLVPFPEDLQRAFVEALRPSPGMMPFTDDARIVARRISTVKTPGVGTTDTTGFARDLRSMGDWR